MMLIIRTIESNTSRVGNGEADSVITDEEAAQFMKKRKSGVALQVSMPKWPCPPPVTVAIA